MDATITERFAAIVNLAQMVFGTVTYHTDSTHKRALLNLQGTYGHYRVFVTELFSEERRKYRYYVLLDNWVVAGFDNSPDPRAIRLKYGKIGSSHAGEYIPHLHQKGKTSLTLTEEMSFEKFVAWVEFHVSC